jgi:transposase-like protein
MAVRRKGEVYELEFRDEVLERMRRGERVAHLSRALGIAESVLYEWRSKAQPLAGGPTGREDEETREIRRLRTRVAGLESALGREVMEKDFFASALRRVAGRRGTSDGNGSKTSGLKSAAGWHRKAD